MAPFYIFLALLIQASFTFANTEHEEFEIDSRQLLTEPLADDEVVKDYHDAKKDWIDMFLLPDINFHPSSSVAMMTQVTNSDKSPEEQLEDIKETANKITLAIQSEIANLLAFALSHCGKETEENGLRKKRSIETPMDSTQLVSRLLRHIKSNNEYQNIAIEKMMSAQEIADKFNIEFHPDTDFLSDLAIAATEQTKELSSILQDVYELKNASQSVEFVPLGHENQTSAKPNDENTYYVYSVHPKEIAAQHFSFPPHEFVPEQVFNAHTPVNHGHHYEPHHQHHNYHPHETQIMPPPVQQHYSPPVTQRPNFYEPIPFTPAPEPFTPAHVPFTPAPAPFTPAPTPFTPVPEYHPHYFPMEPVTTTTTIVLPVEEVFEPEPELVGEEIEETVSMKTIVDRGDEPGSATVNHVTTYTINEKSHFRTPQIENLPQQMQYYFFLM